MKFLFPWPFSFGHLLFSPLTRWITATATLGTPPPWFASVAFPCLCLLALLLACERRVLMVPGDLTFPYPLPRQHFPSVPTLDVVATLLSVSLGLLNNFPAPLALSGRPPPPQGCGQLGFFPVRTTNPTSLESRWRFTASVASLGSTFRVVDALTVPPRCIHREPATFRCLPPLASLAVPNGGCDRVEICYPRPHDFFSVPRTHFNYSHRLPARLTPLFLLSHPDHETGPSEALRFKVRDPWPVTLRFFSPPPSPKIKRFGVRFVASPPSRVSPPPPNRPWNGCAN